MRSTKIQNVWLAAAVVFSLTACGPEDATGSMGQEETTTQVVAALDDAQAISYVNSGSQAGVVPTSSTYFGYLPQPGWFQGKISEMVTNYEFSALTNAQGCFPTGDQVPVDSLRTWEVYNQEYRYAANFSGRLEPGQSFTAKIKSCSAGGDQPFIQTYVYYDLAGKGKNDVLTGFVIDPSGKSIPMGSPSYVKPTETSPNLKGLWGGVSATGGAPGTWTVVLSNNTRYPVTVNGATLRVILL